MKRYILMLVMAFAVIFTTSCNKEEKAESTEPTELNENSMADIYYPDVKQVVKGEKRYQLKQPDSISSSVEELMACIMSYLDERMEYHTYLLDGDDNLTLQFTCNGEYDKEYMLLSYAAVTRTLFQIKDINSISIALSDAQGDIIESNFYLRNSFYFYDYQD